MRVDWTRTVAPVSDPVTLEDTKLHCRALADVEDEDDLITSYLRAATALVEEQLGRGLLTQTWKQAQDWFADETWLARAAPLQSVTSVKYYDTAGVLQTLSTSIYRADTVCEPGRVLLKPTQVWPTVQSDRGQAVEVTYVCGWTSADAIPAPIKAALYLLVDHLWENRGAVVVGVGVGAVELPLGVGSLLAPYRVSWRPPRCW